MPDDSTRRPYDLFGSDDVRIPAGTSPLITVSDPAGSEAVDRLLGRGADAGEHLLVSTTDDPATTGSGQRRPTTRPTGFTSSTVKPILPGSTPW